MITYHDGGGGRRLVDPAVETAYRQPIDQYQPQAQPILGLIVLRFMTALVQLCCRHDR